MFSFVDLVKGTLIRRQYKKFRNEKTAISCRMGFSSLTFQVSETLFIAIAVALSLIRRNLSSVDLCFGLFTSHVIPYLWIQASRDIKHLTITQFANDSYHKLLQQKIPL